MSNTSSITPYESSSSSSSSGQVAGLAAVACVAAAAGLVAWLAKESDQDREAKRRSKEQRRRERLDSLSNVDRSRLVAASPVPEITTVNLRIRDAESLVESARKLGYRAEKLPHVSSQLVNQSPILLRGASGERIAITRSRSGGLDVHTSSRRPQVESLVRQHTVDRAIAHLKARGLSVQTGTLANGETQILANESQSPRQDGTAEIKAHINADGSVLVDVDKVRGNRCAEIVQDLAAAVGGAVCGCVKKDSYFQLPGEPTSTAIKL